MTKLEFIRREKGITQTDLAKAIGAYSTYITAIERGSVKSWPKIRRQIAEYFGLDERLLFDDDGWPLKVESGLVGYIEGSRRG